jgi:hypothetical protein
MKPVSEGQKRETRPHMRSRRWLPNPRSFPTNTQSPSWLALSISASFYPRRTSCLPTRATPACTRPPVPASPCLLPMRSSFLSASVPLMPISTSSIDGGLRRRANGHANGDAARPRVNGTAAPADKTGGAPNATAAAATPIDWEIPRKVLHSSIGAWQRSLFHFMRVLKCRMMICRVLHTLAVEGRVRGARRRRTHSWPCRRCACGRRPFERARRRSCIRAFARLPHAGKRKGLLTCLALGGTHAKGWE